MVVVDAISLNLRNLTDGSFMTKRLFDLAVGALALLVLSPILLSIAVLIKLSDRGPVLYRGRRIGFHGRPFFIYKFRTMVVNAEHMGFGPSTARNDTRITRVGRVLRQYKLDELPQLMNIVKGDMSVVGPRPQVERFTQLYGEEEQVIFSVRPGLTDYASIKFINLGDLLGDENIEEKYLREIEPEKNRLRIKYAREHSFLIDLKIIWQTIVQLFRVKLAWNIKSSA